MPDKAICSVIMSDIPPFDLARYVSQRRALVDEALDRLLPRPDEPYDAPVFEAMRYSIMASGKRLRPILLLAGAEAVGSGLDALLPFACALECIHTYSLIHDDLPAMDDDDLRRGRPTCHKAFGEAVAILAGDGLLTLAFELMTRPEGLSVPPQETVLKAIRLLASAAGVSGMVGGQTADILTEGKEIDAETLEAIHRKKTGALIAASVEMGGLLGGGDPEKISSLREYGTNLGLAFQITDDILDVTGDPSLLGKKTGADARRKKATYPALYGIDEAKRRADDLVLRAIKALSGLGSAADPLRAIAIYVKDRDR